MTERENVYLEALDGSEFEKLCSRLLERLGFGRVENVQDVADEGRDLLIHSTQGLIIVECKHHPHSSVGRPVVQKLHSAVISSNGNKGMLITTGTFSKEAVEHAKKLHPTIELIDRNGLIDMATRAGIDLMFEGRKHTSFVFPISNSENFQRKLRYLLDGLFQSYPKKASNLMQLEDRNVNLIPSYIVQYDLKAIFETSVGVIHRETVEDGIILLNGVDGSLFQPDIAKHLRTSSMQVFDPKTLGIANSAQTTYSIDITTLKKFAKSHIAKTHTKNASYLGANFVQYVKTCIPKEKDIFISDIKQVYLPMCEASFRLLAKNHTVKFVENQTDNLLLTKSSLLTCGVCGSDNYSKMLLCNECGNGCHLPDQVKGHGFICKMCGKTVCRKCARFVRKYIIFKKALCGNCAQIVKENEGKNPKIFQSIG